MTIDHVRTNQQLNIEIIKLAEGVADVDPLMVLTEMERQGIEKRLQNQHRFGLVIGLTNSRRIVAVAIPFASCTNSFSNGLAARLKAVGCNNAIVVYGK